MKSLLIAFVVLSMTAGQSAVEIPSPMMAFREQENRPFRVLFDVAVALPDDPEMVEVRLVRDDADRQAIRTYTVACEEELAEPIGGAPKRVHEFTAGPSDPAVFRVRRDSQLTFWVAGVDYDDGSSWRFETQ
jgi:hypothetical protein